MVNYCLSLVGFRIAYRNRKYRLEKNLFFNEYLVYKKFYKKDEELTIFDVGAHVGQSSEQFHKHFPRSKIHAFEPGRDNFSELLRNLGEKDWAVINNLAVGKYEQVSEMYLTGALSTGNSLVKPQDDDSIYERHEVEITTLDIYCTNQGISSIDILKIDTQGYEQECLAGAVKLLEQAKVSILKLEVMLHEAYDKRTSFYAIEQYLLGNGYILFDIPWMKKSSRERRTLVMDVIYLHTSMLDEMHNR